eukprot:352217-Prorocentrum_lima.AAC.1
MGRSAAGSWQMLMITWQNAWQAPIPWGSTLRRRNLSRSGRVPTSKRWKLSHWDAQTMKVR